MSKKDKKINSKNNFLSKIIKRIKMKKKWILTKQQ